MTSRGVSARKQKDCQKGKKKGEYMSGWWCDLTTNIKATQVISYDVTLGDQ
jgi:hypothetical protein